MGGVVILFSYGSLEHEQEICTHVVEGIKWVNKRVHVPISIMNSSILKALGYIIRLESCKEDYEMYLNIRNIWGRDMAWFLCGNMVMFFIWDTENGLKMVATIGGMQ